MSNFKVILEDGTVTDLEFVAASRNYVKLETYNGTNLINPEHYQQVSSFFNDNENPDLSFVKITPLPSSSALRGTWAKRLPSLWYTAQSRAIFADPQYCTFPKRTGNIFSSQSVHWGSKAIKGGVSPETYKFAYTTIYPSTQRCFCEERLNDYGNGSWYKLTDNKLVFVELCAAGGNGGASDYARLTNCGGGGGGGGCYITFALDLPLLEQNNLTAIEVLLRPRDSSYIKIYNPKDNTKYVQFTANKGGDGGDASSGNAGTGGAGGQQDITDGSQTYSGGTLPSQNTWAHLGILGIQVFWGKAGGSGATSTNSPGAGGTFLDTDTYPDYGIFTTPIKVENGGSTSPAGRGRGGSGGSSALGTAFGTGGYGATHNTDSAVTDGRTGDGGKPGIIFHYSKSY